MKQNCDASKAEPIRQLSYTIPGEWEEHKISEFLRNQGYAKQNLVELKKMKESILLNGRWEYLHTSLKAGDLLEVRIMETEKSLLIPPVDLPFPIVYEDQDLLVVNKPAFMPIHPSRNHFENSLGNAAAFYFAQQGRPFVFRCVNRLDRDTTGLTIIAKHMVSCSMLYEQVRTRAICREYTAIVEGEDLPDQGTIDLPIGKSTDLAPDSIDSGDFHTGTKRCVDMEYGDSAVTHYQVLDRGHGLSLVQCHLDTGRTHQIRVHMAAIGHPLIGDFLYNPENHLMNRQALHAGKLSFVHPITGEAMTFQVPLPQDMADLADNYGLR